jgi:hypothetical protein
METAPSFRMSSFEYHPFGITGGIDGGAQGVLVQRLLREDHRLPP